MALISFWISLVVDLLMFLLFGADATEREREGVYLGRLLRWERGVNSVRLYL